MYKGGGQMAKYNYQTQGDFQDLCKYLKDELIRTSMSASLEDEEYSCVNNVNIATLVFERYSYTGGNRLSLNITITEYQNDIRVTAISSGGSQGTFFKFNTLGEESFLSKIVEALDQYKNKRF